MKKLINLLSVTVLVVLLIMSLSNDLFAQRQRPNQGGNHQRPGFNQQYGGFWSQLTDEQKQTLQQKISELRSQTATREEIHAAVVETLESWGIKLPECRGEKPGFNRFGQRHNPIFNQLTEEQQKQLHEKISELRSQNISREDFQIAIKELLKSWGVEVPENFGAGFRRGRFVGHEFFAKLTEEQRKAIQDKVHELRGQEVPRDEIAAAIVAMLEEWGIEVPEDFTENFGKHGPRFAFPRIWKQLTEEQKQTIKNLTDTMREDGANRMEIRQAVREMLEEFGFDLPDRGDRQRPDQRGGDRQGMRDNRGDRKFQTRNYPNPFNPETSIQYTLQNPEYVTLKIYNMQGQLIRKLINEQQGVGEYSVTWDGKNDLGEQAVSGLYLYQLNVGKETFSDKMMLMK